MRRPANNYWLLVMLPENFILIHTVDAAARCLEGDDVEHRGIWDLLSRTV